jgi:hypothetical protein
LQIAKKHITLKITPLNTTSKNNNTFGTLSAIPIDIVKKLSGEVHVVSLTFEYKTYSCTDSPS